MMWRTPSVEIKYPNSFPQGFKANPGLKLANTFGVKLVRKTRSCRFVTQSGSPIACNCAAALQMRVPATEIAEGAF
jgi:hypothetical protein